MSSISPRSSVNEVVCHGIPDFRPLQEGDIINLDLTIYLRGYHGDVSETCLVGTVADSSRQLVKTAYECLWKGIEVCGPDVPFHEIGKAIEKHADSFGYRRAYRAA